MKATLLATSRSYSLVYSIIHVKREAYLYLGRTTPTEIKKLHKRFKYCLGLVVLFLFLKSKNTFEFPWFSHLPCMTVL